tara:strand:+ start:6413 stop:7057 length:645 start_codon:yes stop_codon:yes gene_type:complete
MLLRLLSICLATVLLSSILLFIYFRTKVAKVEEKLEIMFNLIQSHAEQKANTNPQIYQSMHQQEQMNQEANRVNLIEVSDNDEEDEEEDSDSEDSETDNDENGNLVIDEELMKEENIKKIELKVENSDVLFNHLEEESEEIFVQKENEKDSEDEDDAEDDDAEEDKEHHDEDIAGDDLDLSKLKVGQLKKLCSEKGMSGYKKLRKQELINLLQE